MKTKIFRDPIHGYITVNENDLMIIDTYAFQRLRRIRQSGCYTVYPSANHTRFEHSLGVMYLGTRVFDSIIGKLPGEFQEQLRDYTNTVRYACLLHDVGHAPLSHTGELLFNKSELRTRLKELIDIDLPSGSQHEYLSCIIALEVFKEQLEELNCDLDLFCRMITGNVYRNSGSTNRLKNGVIEILNSTIDVDKLDYFSRDSFASGTGDTLVSIDRERLIRSYNIVGGKLCFDSSALSVVANFVYARNTLYMWVYNHHVTVYTDNLLERFLAIIVEAKAELRQEYLSIEAVRDRWVDDYDIFQLLKSSRGLNGKTESLYTQYFSRQYYKAVWKNQFQLRELFTDAGAQLARFREMNIWNIEDELRRILDLEETSLLGMTANYKVSNPKVYLNFGGSTKDFVEIYKSDIYNSLLDVLPMIYVHPDVEIGEVREAIRKLYM